MTKSVDNISRKIFVNFCYIFQFFGAHFLVKSRHYDYLIWVNFSVRFALISCQQKILQFGGYKLCCVSFTFSSMSCYSKVRKCGNVVRVYLIWYGMKWMMLWCLVFASVEEINGSVTGMLLRSFFLVDKPYPRKVSALAKPFWLASRRSQLDEFADLHYTDYIFSIFDRAATYILSVTFKTFDLVSDSWSL